MNMMQPLKNTKWYQHKLKLRGQVCMILLRKIELMVKFRFYLLFILLVALLSACNKKPTETATKKMLGINGEAIYILNDDGSIAGVVKPDYENEYFHIILNRDTIQLGDEFVASIHVSDSSYRINISKPASQRLESGSTPIATKYYRFSPPTAGEYEFSGTIEWDSVVTPFSFKFLTVD
jgi:hypothetical protein